MSSFKPSTILLIGATGTIGKYITNAILAAKPAFNKVIIFTSGNSDAAKKELLSSWQSQGAEIITGDVSNDADVKKAYEGVDTVISCLGRGALQHQTKIISLAEESGSVQWFFPSEYGTDVEYSPESAHEKPHQLKLAVRKHIRENIKRIKYTYLVTGPYIEMWFALSPNTPEGGGFDLDAKKAVIIGDGEAKIGFITMPDVGKTLVAALRHPEASFNKALKVQSFVTTANAVLAEFKAQKGGEWTVEHVPLPKLKEAEKAAWEANKPYATGYTLRRIWVEGGTLYEKTDNESIGLKPEDMETLQTVVKRAVDGHKW